MEEQQIAAKKKPLTRFGEFELLKAIAIMGLPAVHVMEEALEAGYASPGLTAFSAGIIGLCAYGPSVFMICMGFGIGGGRTSAAGIRKDGFQFLMIGAILNLLRWFLPGLLSAIVLHTHLIDDFNFCVESDIYYFVGLFFLFYSFMKKWNVTTFWLIVICLAMLTVNTLLTPLTRHISNPVIGGLLGNIVYVNEESCFPLLSWAIFPSVGIFLGEVLKKCDEERRKECMRRTLVSSAVMVFSFVVFLLNYRIDVMKVLVSPANDYITDLPNVILLLSLALVLIGLTYYLCRVIGGSGFMAFMLRISAYIIPFYLLQWIIIAWIFYLLPMLGVPAGSFHLGWYFLSVITVMVICTVVSTKYGMKIMKLLLKITSFRKRRKKRN